MTRVLLLVVTIAALVAGTFPSPVTGGDVVDHIHVGFWRNTCWPKPFVYPDRKATFAPMDVMANNGWRRNNLLGAHHFDPAGERLNVAGELRVAWILTQAPIHRRTIYIERSFNAEETGRRIEAAQRFATTVAPEGAIQVVDTHIHAEGKPAADVDSTNVRFRESAPLPVLPEAAAGVATE
jgi:hypothetical protein